MSSHRNHRVVEITCDGFQCHEYIEEEGSFADAWNSAKADGWTSKKLGSEWFNYCPSCSSSFKGKFSPEKLL